jgi:hypothetical protein
MKLSRDELVKVALKHSQAEGAGDMANTVGTLEAEPIYELYPIGRKMIGAALARRYYEHFFAEVQPRITGWEMLAEWIGEDGVLQEYSLTYKYDDQPAKTFRIVGILTFGETKLSGERLYADEELLRIMFAPVWDRMVPA